MNVKSFMRLNNIVSVLPIVYPTDADIDCEVPFYMSCEMPYCILCVDEEGVWHPVFISEDVFVAFPDKLKGGVVKGFFDGLVVTERMNGAGFPVPVLTVGTTDVEELI